MQALTLRYPNANTRYAHCARVRSIVVECARLHLIDRATSVEILEVLRIRAEPGGTFGRALEAAELQALLQAAADDPDRIRGAEDAAIVAVLATTGMRACELGDIDAKDYNSTRQTLMIQPKGRAGQRTCFVPENVATYLDLWMTHRPPDQGPLFADRQERRLMWQTLQRRLDHLAGARGGLPLHHPRLPPNRCHHTAPLPRHRDGHANPRT